VRRIQLFTAGVGLLCALGLARAGEPGDARIDATLPRAASQESSCGRFGTRVEFLNTPSEAARQAKNEEKLVFVLHVSGHFEDPRFT
jgi:hypothetical protein